MPPVPHGVRDLEVSALSVEKPRASPVEPPNPPDSSTEAINPTIGDLRAVVQGDSGSPTSSRIGSCSSSSRCVSWRILHSIPPNPSTQPMVEESRVSEIW